MGDLYRAEAGIPQGDPLSMMIAAMVMRPWAEMMRDHGNVSYLYVDDIMVMTSGEGMLEKIEGAMGATLEYLGDIGANISAENHTCLQQMRNTDKN